MLIIQWFLMGFVLAAPVGPIGVLCVHRTLTHGFKRGIITWFGAATADVFYAGVAAFWLTFIADFFLRFEHALRIAGILFLLYFSVMIYRSKPVIEDIPSTTKWVGDYLWALLLSLAHPVTIIVSGGIFLSLTPSVAENNWLLFASVSLGSIACWSLLVTGAYIFRKKIREKDLLGKIGKIAGVIILLCTLALVWSEFKHLK